MAKFQEYKMGCVPAVVVNEEFESRVSVPAVTLDDALREDGL